MITFSKKIEEIEEVNGDYKILTVGGHICIIKSASIYTGTNGQSLKIEIDIAEKDLKDYYKEQFDNNTSADKKWNNNATKYFSLKEENEKYLKGLGTSVNESNANTNVFTKVDGKDVLDETKLVGKLVGGVFGLKEYTATDGTIKNTVEIRNFRSKDKLNEVKIPKVAKINGKNEFGYDTYEMVDYDEYMESKKNQPVQSAKKEIDPFAQYGNSVEITDNLLD